MTHEHRTKIAKSQILKCLIEHATGTREMSATQVTAGVALLKKVLPDLSNIELSGDPDNPVEVVGRIELVSPSVADSQD
jgi:hypothetical protein